MLEELKERYPRVLTHLAGGCLLLALAAGLPGCSSESPPGEPISFEAGKDFPSFELVDLGGVSRRSADLLSRATLVSFFFPTCTACNQEMPFFQDLYEKYRDQGLNVVAINVFPEQDDQVADWRDRSGYTFPILIGADTDRLIENYRLTSTPLNYLLDGQGKVLFRMEGYIPGSEPGIESRVRRALAIE